MTLEQANQHLQAWLSADLALATGKEYNISGRMLTEQMLPKLKNVLLTGQGRSVNYLDEGVLGE